MYTLTFGPAAYRVFKKLPPLLQQEIRERAEALTTNPLAGEPLQGRYRLMRSVHFGFKGTAYRIVYQVLVEEKQIVIRLADKRENIYKRLEEMGV